LSAEIRRIVLEQLDAATSELTSIGDPESDETIHDARRRVKKIRAVIRLVRPVLDGRSHAVDADLSDVSHLLAPVADGQGVIETVDELARRYPKALPREMVEAIRADLLERERRIDAVADADHILDRAAITLRSERPRVQQWQLTEEGFRALAPGLRQSVRRAREAMIATWTRPTPDRHHVWRRRVKEHWLHVRLIEAGCGDHLLPYQRRLETLDGILGEYHNVVLLREVLTTDTALSRREAAQCLRIVAKYQRLLRRHSQVLGARIYVERPRQFVRRVKRLWRAATAASPTKKGHSF
jgi:hypothetical protein